MSAPRRWAVVASSLVLALAACSSATSSSSSSSSSSSTSSSTNPTTGATTIPASVTSVVEEKLATTMQAYDVPGAVVAVCAPGYDRWVTTAGMSDLEAKTPMSADLVWGLRSITKSFTVTLLLQLADEGKISLSDPIGRWIDGVPNGDVITLEQLARMSSGVPEYTTQAFIEDYSKDVDRAFTDDELISYATAEPAMYTPGTQHVYVNTSTVLLGRVVEKVTGQSFADALRSRILTPLGLSDTTYPSGPSDWSGPHPQAYQPEDDGTMSAQPNNFTIFGPAGAMTSTVTDLCRWATALGSGELLAPGTQRDRVTGTPLDKGPEYDIYGEGIGTLNGWVGHTGEGLGVTALVMHDPASKVSAVILMNVSNLGDHVPTKLFRSIAADLAQIPPSSAGTPS